MNIFCKYRNNKNRGFTLIELLVVVSIIGMLSSVMLVSLQSARTKARETKLLVEVKEFQKALELYKLDNGKYPASEPGNAKWYGYNTCTDPQYGLITSLFDNNFTSKYISKIPQELQSCGFRYVPSTGTTNVTGYNCAYIGQAAFEFDGFNGAGQRVSDPYAYAIFISTSANSFTDYPVLYGPNYINTEKCILGPKL